MLTTSCAQRRIQLRLNLFSALKVFHLTQSRIYFRLLTDSVNISEYRELNDRTSE
jgi:hypothetical protein